MNRSVTIKSLVLVLGVFLSLSSVATNRPRPYHQDRRIQYVVYQPHDVVPVYGTPMVYTLIRFGKGETISQIQVADSGQWQYPQMNYSAVNYLLIKPTHLGSNTDMFVMTNKHTYVFHLISPKSFSRHRHKTVYSIQFVYPKAQKDKMLHALQAQHILRDALRHRNRYNWHYAMSGNPLILPRYVFDDGVFTYFVFYQHEPIPVIEAVFDAKGHEAMVNPTVVGHVVVVHQVAPQYTLRMGKHIVASIYNEPLIHNIKRYLR